jgi:hypothetical protein
MTKQFSNYSDLLTFTRASKGHALRPVSYGSELVTNGGFDTDSDWTKGTGWTISGGAAVSNNASGYGDVRQNLSLTANKIYRLEFSVTSYTSGVVKPYLGNSGNSLAEPYGRGNLTAGLTADSAGDFYAFFVYDASQISQILFRSNNGFIGSIDNVSVKEVTFDQPDGTLTLFEHPDNVPRVEWDADRNRLGLLVEESRTNKVPYSNFSAGFGETRTTLTTDQAVSPDGTENAAEITETTDTGAHYISTGSLTVTASTSHTLSVFVKQGSGTRSAILRTNNEGADDYVVFDFATESITETGNGASNATSQSIGNDWYRISFTYTQSADTSSGIIVGLSDSTTPSDDLPSYTGDGSSSIFVYGLQFEQGSFPTSYIKNEGTSGGVTRSADVASIPVADFGYNQSAGSLLFEFEKNNTDGAYLLDFEGSVSSQIQVVNDGDLRVRATRSPDVTLTLESPYVASVSTRKIAYTLKSGDHSAVLDGGSAQTSASTNATSEISTLYIGSDGGADLINGHIKSIKYYPRRLSNAQLVELTS